MSSTNTPSSSRIAVAAAVAGCLALVSYRHYKQSRRIVGNDETPPSTPGGSARKKKKKRKRNKKKKSSVPTTPIDPTTFQFPPRAKCPLCKVTLPLKQSQKTFLLCCGTEICRACNASAYAAGIRANDLVVKIANREISDPAALGDLFADYQVGEKIPVIVYRNEKEETKTVTLGRLAEVYRSYRR